MEMFSFGGETVDRMANFGLGIASSEGASVAAISWWASYRVA